jgi:lipoate-protein ligase A
MARFGKPILISAMPPPFALLGFFFDKEPHAAPLNMAIDEALLGEAMLPVLRSYRWARPAVSFGYFEKVEPARAAFPGNEIVRRWTGGGIVRHGHDFTFSLLVPASHPFARASTGAIYEAIHRALAAALAALGFEVVLAGPAGPARSRACFENPVPHDLLLGGRKIAGGAQRRTRTGLLHQGSIQEVALPIDFGAQLASHLADRVEPVRLSRDGAALAESLAQMKYGSAGWIERV